MKFKCLKDAVASTVYGILRFYSEPNGTKRTSDARMVDIIREAEAYGISERTVFRKIQILHDAGLISYDPGTTQFTLHHEER